MMDVFRQIYWIIALTGLVGLMMGMLAVASRITILPLYLGGAGVICSALPWIIIAPKQRGISV